MLTKIKKTPIRSGCLFFLIAIVIFLYVGDKEYSDRKERARAIAQSGVPIVEAIYRYQLTKGLFPYQLKDLVPEYLSKNEIVDWEIGWMPHVWYIERWPVTAYVWSSFHKESENHWFFIYMRTSIKLDVKQTIPKELDINMEQLKKNIIMEFKKRIQKAPDNKYPSVLVHFEGYISFLMKNELYKEVIEICLEMRARKSLSWLLERALARARGKLGKFREAEKEFLDWVSVEPTFHKYYFIAQFYEYFGKKDESIKMLKKATHYKLKSRDYLMNAALHAYEKNEYDLAIEICDIWEEYKNRKDDWVQDYLIVRAASMLALGKHKAALQDVQQIKKEHRQSQPIKLLRAIDKKNTTFRLSSFKWFEEDFIVNYN